MSREDSPLGSIGIPTYNQPEGVKETLQRLSVQTYKNLEIIVSDNCSSDETAYRKVMAEFSSDSRIRYVRQTNNLGPVRNLRFLLNQAAGKYFMWAADDDFLEPTYVEKLVGALEANPNAAIAMSGYDVMDTMADPPIKVELTRHLFGLTGETPFLRLRKYIRQPDHFGKSRLVWGMFPREKLKVAFEHCLAGFKEDEKLIWGDIPVDFRMLAVGDLVVVDENLFHMQLLPTSDGRQSFTGTWKKLWSIIDRSVRAYELALETDALSARERAQLRRDLRWYRLKSKVQVFGYYGIIGRFPRLARWIKKIVFYFIS